MRSKSFDGAPSSAAGARRFVASQLSGLSTEACEKVTLMVSELASNAIRHARTRFRVGVERTDHTVRVEVTDSGGGDPVRRSPDPTEPSGRGLLIINALADEWGVHHERGIDTTVWFTLDVRSDRTLAG